MSKPSWLSNKLLLLVLIVATALRLINLGHPKAYIFDEVYHAFTAREYLHGNIAAWEWWTTPPPSVAYEWTHPPVAKYGMEAGMYIFGENSFGWRIGSAIFGIFCILGLYQLVLAITKNKQIALIAASLVSIEGTHIAQSRIAMNDMYMLCFYIWSLYLAVKTRWKGAALLYGLALASKWSALYGIIPLACIYLAENDPRKWNIKSILLHLLFTLRLFFIVISVYVLTFAPFIVAGHDWAQWWELHRQMWYYHTHLIATHGYQSTPLQWLFGARPVWYFVEYLDAGMQNIYVQGNPFILWLGLAALVIQLRSLLKFKSNIFYILYAVFTLPWIFSPRIMFYYHYLPSSVFLCVILATWLNSLPTYVRTGLLVVCTLGLIAISPMLYGFFMPTTYWDALFNIFPTWK
jgi:dolichyl-phosphate-mannose-protein mannosyltransferase